MLHLKKFEKFEKQNESFVFLPGLAIGLLLYYGIMYGYEKIHNLIDIISFARATQKAAPIFDKVRNDYKIVELFRELGKYKDHLYYGEEEGSTFIGSPREKAFQIVDDIFKRAEELLDEKEFETFKSSIKEFDRYSGKPGGYFVKKVK